MTDIFISTKNIHKVKEFKRILEPLGLNILCERDLGRELPEVEENGTTLTENSLLKARAGCEQTGMISVADDTGLFVSALGGAPGISAARYAGEGCTPQDNRTKMLNALKDVPDSERDAYFECTIACVFPNGTEICVSGRCDGFISRDEAGDLSFGYDAIFECQSGRFSAISGDEKDRLSHRGKALRKFAEEIKKYLDEIGIKYKDFGTNSEERCDYPEFPQYRFSSRVPTAWG